MAKKKAKKGGKKKKKKKASGKKKRALRKAGNKKAAAKKSANKKKKAGKKKKANKRRHTHGQHGGTVDVCICSVDGSCDTQRATRAESSSRLALPDGFPAVTGTRRRAGTKVPCRPSKLSGPAWVQSAQETRPGRSARLPCEAPF